MSKKLIFNSLVVTLCAVLAISTTALGQQRRNFQSQAGNQKDNQAASQTGNQSSSNRAAQDDAATVFRSARDFIDVEEMVQIYWKLIQTPPAYGEVVNVCSGAPVKIRAALDALLTMAGVHIDVQVDPVRLKAVDVPVHYGSRLKLQQLIGETEAIPLALSLERIFAAMLHA